MLKTDSISDTFGAPIANFLDECKLTHTVLDAYVAAGDDSLMILLNGELSVPAVANFMCVLHMFKPDEMQVISSSFHCIRLRLWWEVWENPPPHRW